jgi:hypothetical protein
MINFQRISRSILFIFLISACAKEHETPIIPIGIEEADDGDPDIGDLTNAEIFYDKFDKPIDEEKWERVHALWGQADNPLYQHGGVIRENVTTRSGFAVLKSLGDLYEGNLQGVDGHNKRLGGVLKSRKRFASGRYEVKMKVLQVADVGVLSTAWVYWSKTISGIQFPEAYNKAIAHGNTAENNLITLNHEIDIEVKGQDLANPVFTNWIGLKKNEYVSQHTPTRPLLDNKFHVYCWIWHTGSETISPEIKYYIDDELIYTSTEHIPYIAGYFYVGNWFAWWAGNDDGSYNSPAFSSMDMLVDWVKISPFNEPNDDWFE